MKIRKMQLCPYDFTYVHGYRRQGALIKLESENGELGEGDLAPLIERSKESLEQSIKQFREYQALLTSMEWNPNDFLDQLASLNLLPSLAFALESAFFTIFRPNESYSLNTAAMLAGKTVKQILEMAELRKNEGFTTAKLKISNLMPEDAFTAINELKGVFKLRIDANSRWSLSESVRFFSQFPMETFEYIEDPVQSLNELQHFPYPIAVEELLSKGMTFSELETIPMLKAIVYKPTVQGGYLVGLALKQWADKRGVALVLSSSLESDVGHRHLVAIAGRLGLTAPIGIGTYHYLNDFLCDHKLHFRKGVVSLL